MTAVAQPGLNNQIALCDQALGKDKLLFNRDKPLAEPGSGTGTGGYRRGETVAQSESEMNSNPCFYLSSMEILVAERDWKERPYFSDSSNLKSFYSPTRYHINPIEPFALRWQTYLWFLGYFKPLVCGDKCCAKVDMPNRICFPCTGRICWAGRMDPIDYARIRTN